MKNISLYALHVSVATAALLMSIFVFATARASIAQDENVDMLQAENDLTSTQVASVSCTLAHSAAAVEDEDVFVVGCGGFF